MIQLYETGSAFLAENADLLRTQPYATAFFFLDAPLIQRTDSRNYALRITDGDTTLLALKAAPYCMLLFGSAVHAEALADFLMDGGYEAGELLGDEAVCAAFADAMNRKYGDTYGAVLSMTQMECRTVTEPSYDGIEIPTEADMDELCSLTAHFIADCGLTDEVNPDGIRKTLGQYRILRDGGRIASMAKLSASTPDDMRISCVYTRPELRGRQYARKVVNSVKNEILRQGKVATLNVDNANPISNHLYESLGFVRLFTQGLYRP